MEKLIWFASQKEVEAMNNGDIELWLLWQATRQVLHNFNALHGIRALAEVENWLLVSNNQLKIRIERAFNTAHHERALVINEALLGFLATQVNKTQAA